MLVLRDSCRRGEMPPWSQGLWLSSLPALVSEGAQSGAMQRQLTTDRHLGRPGPQACIISPVYQEVGSTEGP